MPIYETHEFVDFSKDIDKNILPAIENFVITINNSAIEMVNEETINFKEFFAAQLDVLDEALEAKLKEKADVLKDANKRLAMIRENESRLKWLDVFITELNGVLEI